jgi:ribosomal protein L20A (L18A)
MNENVIGKWINSKERPTHDMRKWVHRTSRKEHTETINCDRTDDTTEFNSLYKLTRQNYV